MSSAYCAQQIFVAALLWSTMILIQSAPVLEDAPDEFGVIGFPNLLSYDYMKTDDGYEYRFVCLSTRQISFCFLRLSISCLSYPANLPHY